jgi:hypothetical protein
MIKWSDYFTYDTLTGILRWKHKHCSKICVGDIAGCPTTHGYLVVRLHGKLYKVHRIVYEMINGPIPPHMEIDHVNGTTNDNRIVNLRLATRGQNTINVSKRSDNTSGTPGVSWYKPTSKWTVYINIQGKRKYLGYFKDEKDAINARINAEKIYHGEFSYSKSRCGVL